MMRIKIVAIVFGVVAAGLLFGCSDNNGSTAPQALVSPARLAASGGGSFVVTDYEAETFCLVDQASLTVTTCYPAKGKPSGVAYTTYKGGRYYVGNRSVRSVDIFDARGAFLGHLGGKTGLFARVNDFAINDEDEFIYVLDSENAVVRVYDLDGNLFSSDLTGGGLVRPAAIDYTVDGTLYISDFGGFGDVNDPADDVMPQIRIYDRDGTLLSTIEAFVSGGFFDKSQSFSTPQGLAVYNNHLFVVDSTSSEVQAYDLAAVLPGPNVLAPVKTVGTRGVDVGQLFYPLDVHIDPASADLFVADNRNGRISVFRGEGMVP